MSRVLAVVVMFGLGACDIEGDEDRTPSTPCAVLGEAQKDCETWYDPSTGLIHERCDWTQPCYACSAANRDGNGCYRNGVLTQCLAECPEVY